MHAVTNTQSKKGNGLGMANVMYDKKLVDFLFLFSFFLDAFYFFSFCRSLSTNIILFFISIFYFYSTESGLP